MRPGRRRPAEQRAGHHLGKPPPSSMPALMWRWGRSRLITACLPAKLRPRSAGMRIHSGLPLTAGKVQAQDIHWTAGNRPGSISGLSAAIDTSAAKFQSTPRYLAEIIGSRTLANPALVVADFVSITPPPPQLDSWFRSHHRALSGGRTPQHQRPGRGDRNCWRNLAGTSSGWGWRAEHAGIRPHRFSPFECRQSLAVIHPAEHDDRHRRRTRSRRDGRYTMLPRACSWAGHSRRSTGHPWFRFSLLVGALPAGTHIQIFTWTARRRASAICALDECSIPGLAGSAARCAEGRHLQHAGTRSVDWRRSA